MHVTKSTTSKTSIKLNFTVSEADLGPIKQRAVQKLGADLKLAGFRAGKAPLNLLEKSVDQTQLQTEVMEEAVNQFYVQGIEDNHLRPVARPEVEITKFVPFSALEFTTQVAVVGDIKLPDYKKIKLAKPTVKVTDQDISEVLQSLKSRLADKQDVTRAAKDGDEVTIDFKGVDDKGEAINGAEGKAYPLILGSDSFIPGFESNLIGLKAGQSKTFTIAFPKDYGVSALASKKVTFTVDVTKVQELVEPKLDDAFAAKAGPFKTLKDLKADIKAQLTNERQTEAARQYESELIEKITKQSRLEVPDSLIDDQLESAEKEERQNLMYRGQTWEEHLKAEGVTEAEHRQRNRAPAAERVKAGLVLSEIAEQEKLDVSPQELDSRIEILKGQYQDPAMQAELDKPENRRDIAGRILTEKTIAKLVSYATN
jgi:trigger factor